MSRPYRLPICWLGALVGLGISIHGGRSWAQEATFPPCPPPANNEYLLLIRSETEADRTRVQDLLPANNTVLVCNYLGETVVRAGGFTSLETANAWAQYMTDVEGLQTFVARPPVAAATPPLATATTEPVGTPAGEATAYNPQPLTGGYAVLIDYRNRPEVALDVQAALKQNVGLAVYRQRPYLLASHSTDLASASATLQTLSSQNFEVFMVDSSQIVVLTSNVALSPRTTAPEAEAETETPPASEPAAEDEATEVTNPASP